MTAPNTRRTLSSLLMGSLLLCTMPQTASSQQNAGTAGQGEQVVQTCFMAPAEQALPACEELARGLSQMPDSPVQARIGIHARLSKVLEELGRDAEAEAPARKALTAAQETKQQGWIGAQQNRLAGVLMKLGRYSEAEALLRNATELNTKEYGGEAVQVAAAMGNLAVVLQAQGKLEEAESLYRKALAIKEKKLAPDHPSLATTLVNLAGVLKAQGKLEEAESLYRKALAIFEKKLAPDHPDLATTLGNLAGVLKDQGKLEEAESLYRKALAIQEKKLAPDHPSLATTLGNLAVVLQAQGKLEEAESLYRKALAIQEKKLAPDHPGLATTLVNLAGVLKAQGKLEEAESLYRKALAIQEKKLAPDHPGLATTLVNLAGVLKAQGKLEEAESLYRKALAIQEKKLAPDHPGLATTLVNLAWVLKDQGKLEEAESLYRKALAIEEKKLAPDHPGLATTLVNLAGVLKAQGKLEEAESLYRKALAIKEKKLAPDHPDLATTLGNLAVVLQDQGRLEEAESLYRKALAIEEKKLAPDHPSLATTLGNLAGVLYDQGKLEEAESLSRKALAIYEKKLAPDHPSLATTLGNLAVVLKAQGKLEEAESLSRKALAIYEKKLAPDHPSLATTLGNLAGVLEAQGKLEEAESLYRKALAIEEKKLAPDHPSLAKTLVNLAGVLYDQGKLEEAESLFRKALAIFEKKLAPDHPSLATTHSNLSLLHLAQGNIKSAVSEQHKSIQPFDSLLRTSPTEDWAEALLDSQSANERAVYGLPLLPGAPPEAAQLTMSTALLFKGRTLEAGRMVRRKLQQGLKTEEQKQKYQQMLALLGQRDQELTRMAQGGGSRERAQELLWQAQKLERELSKEVGVQSSADVPALADVNQKVARSLPKDAVLVEFGLGSTADYRRTADWGTTITYQYVAMMLFPSGEVRVVRLGGKDEVEGASKTLLAALSQSSSDIIPAAKSAYAALFAPLEKELAGVRQVILSPDGALGAIPFGALHDGRGYLVDRLSFRYISSGRDLLNPPSGKLTTQPAVMMATRVPGQEVLGVAEQVGKALAQTLGAKLTERATDGHVLAQQSPSVLTLISHGYFGGENKGGGMSARLPTPPKRTMKSRYMGWMGFERDDVPQAKLVMAEREKTEELMNSSGLMMMPGSQASTDTRQDGRLTAVEVREMNLPGTKLVLLLACKGAAGGLSFGQGVYGLRRAVLQAGAETVVGTLWSVEEKSASELAKNYMTKLWTDKTATRVGAMEDAMKQLRKDRRYSHPHYWAPFVVMGMDGPLAQ